MNTGSRPQARVATRASHLMWSAGLPCLLVFLLVCVTACNPTVEFDVDVDSEATVERGSVLEGLLEAFAFGDFVNMDVSSTSEFENHHAEKERVVNARLVRATLTITAPEQQDFDFIEHIAFFVSAPGQPEREVASKQVPRDVRSFELEMPDLDLAPYVRADTMSLTTEVTGRRPSEDTTLRAALRFHIEAAL